MSPGRRAHTRGTRGVTHYVVRVCVINIFRSHTGAENNTHTPRAIARSQVLEKAEFNKYEKMAINVLTIFEFRNEEALRTVMLDYLIDGAMFITPTGLVAGSGISVLDLAKGSRQGGKKTQAASSAAQGDGVDEYTRAVTIKLSEDDAQDKLSKDAHPKVTMFNGALGEEPGGKEGYKIPLRDPTAPVVTDEEFVRLAQDGHVNGVETFLEANQGRVDEPKSAGVSGGVVWGKL